MDKQSQSLNNDKELAEIYKNLYNGCVKFKEQKKINKSSKEINCDKYYQLFETYSIKYIHSKEDQF